MMRLFRGLVIDLNLDPGRGSETGKILPCVVVTNNIYNEKVPVIQVVPITSWNPKKSPDNNQRGNRPDENEQSGQKINCRLSANSPCGLSVPDLKSSG